MGTRELTQNRLRQLVSYDPSTGDIRWLHDGHLRKAGDLAGWTSKGYRSVRIDGRTYMHHRLAWLYVYGRFSNVEIDHIDMNKSNNEICNLREATKSDNKGNTRPSRANKTGVKGVHFHTESGKYRAAIKRGGKLFSIGRFSSIDEAKKAYDAASIAIFKEFSAASAMPNGPRCAVLKAIRARIAALETEEGE